MANQDSTATLFSWLDLLMDGDGLKSSWSYSHSSNWINQRQWTRPTIGLTTNLTGLIGLTIWQQKATIGQ